MKPQKSTIYLQAFGWRQKTLKGI